MTHHHNIVSHSDDDTDHDTEKSWYCCSAKLGNSWAEQPRNHTPGEYLEVDETVMRQSWEIEISTVPALHPKSISLYNIYHSLACIDVIGLNSSQNASRSRNCTRGETVLVLKALEVKTFFPLKHGRCNCATPPPENNWLRNAEVRTVGSSLRKLGSSWCSINVPSKTHRIHVWYIW